MLAKLSCPVRSLIVIAMLAFGWVVFLLSTRDDDGWLVPQQINSVVLSLLGYSALFAVVVEAGRQRDRRTDERLTEMAVQLAEVRDHVCTPQAPTTEPGYVNGYLAGVAAQPGAEAKVIHLHP